MSCWLFSLKNWIELNLASLNKFLVKSSYTYVWMYVCVYIYWMFFLYQKLNQNENTHLYNHALWAFMPGSKVDASEPHEIKIHLWKDDELIIGLFFLEI
jgi:hypothetical protein